MILSLCMEIKMKLHRKATPWLLKTPASPPLSIWTPENADIKAPYFFAFIDHSPQVGSPY